MGSIEGNEYIIMFWFPDNSVLDGFAIEDGNASENFTDERGVGGGLWQKDSFVVRNCQFRNNFVYQAVVRFGLKCKCYFY